MRVLSLAEAQAFLLQHPVIAADIPSFGLHIEDAGRDYLVALNHTTGEVKVIDTGISSAEWSVYSESQDYSALKVLARSMIAALGPVGAWYGFQQSIPAAQVSGSLAWQAFKDAAAEDIKPMLIKAAVIVGLGLLVYGWISRPQIRVTGAAHD